MGSIEALWYAEWYSFGMTATEQIAVRLPDELLRQLDDMVNRGRFASRAAGVRAGLESLARLEREEAIALAIVEGYRRLPPTSAEDASALASLREAIMEEPW